MSEEIKHMFKSMGEKIVRLAPYVTLLSGLVVWNYLHSIGRVDIFPQVLSFNAGLISILISTTIFALGISMMLIIPSSILIFVRSAYEENSCAERVLIKLPCFCFGFSIIYLLMVYIPFIPEVREFTSGYEPGVIKITAFIFALSFVFVFITLMRGFDVDYKKNKFGNAIAFVWHVIINTIVTVWATLSISIPVSFLMQSSKGESSIAIVFALVFMVAFPFLAFFPAIVYYEHAKIQNEKKCHLKIPSIITGNRWCGFVDVFALS